MLLVQLNPINLIGWNVVKSQKMIWRTDIGSFNSDHMSIVDRTSFGTLKTSLDGNSCLVSNSTGNYPQPKMERSWP